MVWRTPVSALWMWAGALNVSIPPWATKTMPERNAKGMRT